jgi:hypothetical protein
MAIVFLMESPIRIIAEMRRAGCFAGRRLRKQERSGKN